MRLSHLRIVVVEQLPARSFGRAGGLCGGRYRFARGDQRADIGGQPFQVAALVGKRLRPISHSSVTRHHACAEIALSWSITLSQPRMLPSTTGT